MAQVTANLVKPGPMNQPMSVYNPGGSPAASALNSRMSSALKTTTAPYVPKPAVSQTPTAQPYASAPVDNSAVSNQLESIKQQALKIQSAIPGASAGSALQAPVQPQTGATGATGASQTPSYSGLVGSLANQGGSGYNQAAQNSIGGTQGTSQATYGQGYGNAQQSYNDANYQRDKLAQLQNAVAKGNYNVETTPMLGQFQQGREQAIQAMYGGQEQAAATALSADQGLYGTAANQQGTGISGLNSAAGTALTGQSTQQSALNNAALLSQKSQAAQGQTTFDPLTGTYSGGSYQNNLQTVVDSIKNGSIGYTDGVNSLASLSPTAKADVLAALGSGFDTVSSDATAASRGQSQTTLGTNAANITAAQQQQIANYKSAQQQGQNLASQVGDLISKFNLNPAELNVANGAIQKIAQNTSNPQYQILSNYLNDISARYSQVLTPPGGSSTDSTRAVATGMLNSLAQGNSIKSVLDSLDQQASAVIAGVPATGTVPGGSTGGSSGSGGSGAAPTWITYGGS